MSAGSESTSAHRLSEESHYCVHHRPDAVEVAISGTTTHSPTRQDDLQLIISGIFPISNNNSKVSSVPKACTALSVGDLRPGPTVHRFGECYHRVPSVLRLGNHVQRAVDGERWTRIRHSR
jgi:hypothetical protein